jgi:hypothetical protein
MMALFSKKQSDDGPLLQDHTGVYAGNKDDRRAGGGGAAEVGGEADVERPALYYSLQRKALVSTLV